VARMLGLEDRLGRIRQGFIADLLVVNGNPVENLRLLTPPARTSWTYEAGSSIITARSGRETPRSRSRAAAASEWTIKEGIPYHVSHPHARGQGDGGEGPRRKGEELSGNRSLFEVAASAERHQSGCGFFRYNQASPLSLQPYRTWLHRGDDHDERQDEEDECQKGQEDPEKPAERPRPFPASIHHLSVLER